MSAEFITDQVIVGRENDGRPIFGNAKVQYGDVAGFLSHGPSNPPAPTILHRNDGKGLFYAGQVNYLFGAPESGKTWVALAAVAEVLAAGGTAVVLDLDHNTMESIVPRLLHLGVPEDILADQGQFRYKEPGDKTDFMATVADLKEWRPAIVVVDSVGEFLPLMGLSSNSPDDFTVGNTVLKSLAVAGACVLVIDHVSKNPESAAAGPTGTVAKLRAAGGIMLRVQVEERFVPGKGGSCKLRIHKDRHGGLRAASGTGLDPLAATFHLNVDGAPYSVYMPGTSENKTAPPSALEDDLGTLRSLDPAPTSWRDVKDRLPWGSKRVSAAWNQFRGGA